MLSKTECLNLLIELKENGINVDSQVKELFKHNEPTVEILSFIDNHIGLNAKKFYNKLRKSYNNKHSKLYKNIVNNNYEETDPKEVLCTLASLQLQILLFNNNIDDNDFLQTVRFNEISFVLLKYYNDKDIIPSIKLLNLIKLDLKLLEQLNKNN